MKTSSWNELPFICIISKTGGGLVKKKKKKEDEGIKTTGKDLRKF